MCVCCCLSVQVGLTNMNTQAVSDILDAGVPVANNQVKQMTPVTCKTGQITSTREDLLLNCASAHCSPCQAAASGHIVMVVSHSHAQVVGCFVGCTGQEQLLQGAVTLSAVCTGSVQLAGPSAAEWDGGAVHVQGYQGGWQPSQVL